MELAKKLTQCPVCNIQISPRTIERHIAAEHGDPPAIYSQYVLKLPAIKTCECGCGKLITWMGWRRGFTHYVQGHSPSWCRGMTKESDERVAARGRATSIGKLRAYADGTNVVWSKGKTKNDDARLAAAAERSSRAFATGERTPLMKGRSKETDASIAAMAAKISATHRNAELRKRLDSQKRRSPEEVRKLVEEGGELSIVSGLDEYTNENKSILTVTCSKGHVASDLAVRFYRERCRTCWPSGSRAQVELFRWVQSIAPDAINCDRKELHGQELDIFVPTKHFAIEYNGLYWHCEKQKSDGYHASKSQLANVAGISLLHVFDDEWRDKRAIVESMIRHRLGLTPLRLSARQCEIVGLSDAERKEFFERCHIDGDAPRTVSTFGLRHPQHGIVAAMSLRWPFSAGRRAKGELEIARWCCALNTSVAGGCSRLVSTARCIAVGLDARALVTYMDRRHGDGRGYLSAGMRHVGSTPPRFWWTDGKHRFGRLTVKADAKRGLSEKQVAAERGVSRIYCCGNDVYEVKLYAQ